MEALGVKYFAVPLTPP